MINDIEHESYSCLVAKLATFENELRDHLQALPIEEVDEPMVNVIEYFTSRIKEMKIRKLVLEAQFIKV